MMRKIAAKNNRSGFSLAETLFAVLIVLMVSAVVAAGIPVAGRALKAAVDSSHAQVLLSTTMTAMRDELSMAKNIQWVESEKKITYIDSAGVSSALIIKDDGIYLRKDSALSNTSNPNSNALIRDRRLVSEQAATEGLYESFSSADYDSTTGIVSIYGLQVKRKVGSSSEGQMLAGLEEVPFEIEVIAKTRKAHDDR